MDTCTKLKTYACAKTGHSQGSLRASQGIGASMVSFHQQGPTVDSSKDILSRKSRHALAQKQDKQFYRNKICAKGKMRSCTKQDTCTRTRLAFAQKTRHALRKNMTCSWTKQDSLVKILAEKFLLLPLRSQLLSAAEEWCDWLKLDQTSRVIGRGLIRACPSSRRIGRWRGEGSAKRSGGRNASSLPGLLPF